MGGDIDYVDRLVVGVTEQDEARDLISRVMSSARGWSDEDDEARTP